MDAAHEEPTWTSLRAMGGDSIEALLSKKRRLLLISKAYTHRLTASSDVTRPSLAAARIGTPVPFPLPLFSTGETQPNEHASYASLDVHRSAYPELQKHVSVTAPIQPEFLVHALALSSQQQQLQQHDQAVSELAMQANAGPGRGVTPEQAVLLPPFASSMLGQLPDANPIRSPFANCSHSEALGAAAGRYDGIDMPTSVALPSTHLGQQQPQSQRLLLLDTLRRSTSATSADAVSVATLAAGAFSNATGDLHRRGSGSLFAFRRSSICSDTGAARRPSLGLSALIGGSNSACVVGEGGPGSGQPAPFNGGTANTADVSVGILTSRTADELTATHDDSRVGSDDDDENDVFAAVRFPTRLPRRGRVSCSGANTAPPGRTNPRFPAAAEFPDALWPSSVHAAQPNCITGPPGSSTDEHGKTSLGRLPMVGNIDDHDHEGDAYDIGRPAVWPAIEPQGTDQAVAASILKAAKDAAPSVLTRGCAQVSAGVGPEHNAAPSDSTRLPEHAELTAQADPDAHGPGGRPKGDAAAPGADAEVLRVPDSHGDWVGPVPGSAEYAVPATPLSVQVSDAALQAPGSITGGSLRVCKSHAGVSAVGGAPAPGNAGPGGNPASHGTTSPSCVHGMAEPLRQQPYGTSAAAEVTPKHGGLLRTTTGNGMGESVAPTPSACVSGVPSTPDSTPSADARRVMGGPVPRCGVAAAAPYVAHHGRSRQDGHDELMHPGRVLTVQVATVACGDCGAGGTDGPHLHDNMHHHTSSGHQHMYVACLVDGDAEADADRGVQRHAGEAAAKEPQVLQTSAVPGDDLGRLQQLGAPEDCGKAARRLTLYTWLLPHVGPPHLHSTLHLLARAPAAAGDAPPAAPSPSGRPPHDGCRRAGASCAPNPVDATVCAAALRRAHAFRLLVAPDDCLLLLLSSALDGSGGLRRPPEDPGGGLLERRYSGLEDAHRGGDTDIPDGGVSIMIFRHGVWTQQRVLSTPLDSCGSVRFYSLACTQEQLYSNSVEPIGGAALAAKVEGGLGGSGTCSTPPGGSLHDPHHRQQQQQQPSRRGPWWWQVVAAGAGGYGCVWRLAPCTEAVLQVATLPQATCMARPLQGVMELQVLPHKPQWVLGMSCPESCVVLWDVGRVREVARDGEGKAVAGEALGSAAVTWSPAVLLCVVQPDDGVVLWGLQPVGAAAHAGSRRGGMGAATGVVCSGIDEVSGREVEGCGMAGQHVAFLARCSARMIAEGGASYGYGRPDVTEGPSSVVVVLLEEGQLKLGEGLPVAQVASLGLNGRLGVVGTQQGQVLAWDCKHGALTAGWQMPETVTSVDVSERVLLAAAGSEVLVAQV